jgi:hypothetical protein
MVSIIIVSIYVLNSITLKIFLSDINDIVHSIARNIEKKIYIKYHVSIEELTLTRNDILEP